MIDYDAGAALAFRLLWIGTFSALFWYVLIAMTVGVATNWAIDALLSR